MRKSIFKNMDDEGNIEIPEEFFKQLGISEDDEIEIFIEDDVIKIGKKTK